MTDTLRTRIAAAIESIRIQRDGDAVQMADAVIRELRKQYVSKQSMLTEIQSYAEDTGDKQLLRTAEELIETASTWDRERETDD